MDDYVGNDIASDFTDWTISLEKQQMEPKTKNK
jgi:hypothetical protein